MLGFVPICIAPKAMGVDVNTQPSTYAITGGGIWGQRTHVWGRLRPSRKRLASSGVRLGVIYALGEAPSLAFAR